MGSSTFPAPDLMHGLCLGQSRGGTRRALAEQADAALQYPPIMGEPGYFGWRIDPDTAPGHLGHPLCPGMLAMYNPTAFRVDAADRLHALMRAHPLATLVVQGKDAPVANHVPLSLHTQGDQVVLRGHVARANPLWSALGDGRPALAVFHGPQAYVSPGWYPSKREDPCVVPTWNYAVVHAHGTLTAIDDPDWLHALVTQLTDAHEAGRQDPWAVSDAPDAYVAKMVSAVVGLEMAVSRLEGKLKMSQNRDATDRDGVVAGLCSEAGAEGEAVAALVAASRRGPESD